MEENRRSFLKQTAGMVSMATLFPGLSFADEFLYTPADPDAGHVFITKPYLQCPGSTHMTLMWIMNLPSYSYVEYGTTKDLGQVARKTDNGLVVAYNRINQVQLTDLKPETDYYYKIVSKEISKFHPYDLQYGATIESEVYRFKTLEQDQTEAALMIMNDIHDRPKSIGHLMNLVKEEKVDAVFFNGDIFDHQEDEKQIVEHLLAPAAQSFSTKTPFYFVRGNHETRGKFARKIHHYYANPGNQQYYDFTLGSTHFTVIDTGEDKPDDTEVYGQIVDFDTYRNEQLTWFKDLAKSKKFKKAKFRVVLMHIPIYYSGDWHGTMHLRKLFSKAFDEAQIDLCISGHTHRYGVHPPVKGQHNYPIIIGGGPKKDKRTIIKLNADDAVLHISMIRDDGQEVGQYRLES